jgi:hypothetical protein
LPILTGASGCNKAVSKPLSCVSGSYYAIFSPL